MYLSIIHICTCIYIYMYVPVYVYTYIYIYVCKSHKTTSTLRQAAAPFAPCDSKTRRCRPGRTFERSTPGFREPFLEYQLDIVIRADCFKRDVSLSGIVGRDPSQAKQQDPKPRVGLSALCFCALSKPVTRWSLRGKLTFTVAELACTKPTQPRLLFSQ